jgi:hypothetical protein
MTETDPRIENLNQLKARAEEIYEEMYEASRPTAAGGYFSEVKEILYEAIGMAREIGHGEISNGRSCVNYHRLLAVAR